MGARTQCLAASRPRGHRVHGCDFRRGHAPRSERGSRVGLPITSHLLFAWEDDWEAAWAM